MKSYASVDRIEGAFAVCEVEQVDTEDSKMLDVLQKATIMADIPMLKIRVCLGNDVEEGDIIIVEHEDGYVINVYDKDDEEKQRRIEIIKEMMQV